MSNTSSYGGYYSEDSFWEKIKKIIKLLGSESVIYILQLYYMLISEDTPVYIKTLILTALGYFVLPVDAIPDAIIALGYTDDLAIIIGLLKTYAIYVTPEIQMKAQKKANEFFGV